MLLVIVGELLKGVTTGLELLQECVGLMLGPSLVRAGVLLEDFYEAIKQPSLLELNFWVLRADQHG
ncbi:hypothetical protein PG997_014691 [Apiospora hydei]|uniref:Uncharacterized protein n=1 Tax=Apiospora hydei TaxID=1337664 RepID=A0ABR1UUJ9_9PEZI